MINKNKEVDDYISSLDLDRQKAISRLRDGLLYNLPSGFEEVISYGMIGYVVPLSVYPNGYHVKKNTPLPFINLASQKKITLVTITWGFTAMNYFLVGLLMHIHHPLHIN